MAAIKFKSGLDLAPYAIGNAVPGGRSSVEGVQGEMARRVVAMVDAMPPDIAGRFKIISGYRDAARQAEVNPGVKHSRHTDRMALDLANDPTVLGWIDQHPEHGLGFPLKHMPHEQNHMEMMDAGLRAPVGQTPPPMLKGLMAQDGAEADAPAPPPIPAAPLPTPVDPATIQAEADEKQRLYQALAMQQSGLGDAIANLVKQGQAPAAAPEPILQRASAGAPLPLAQPLSQTLR